MRLNSRMSLVSVIRIYLRYRSDKIQQDSNIGSGETYKGISWALASPKVSGGGYFPRTKITARAPTTSAVRITCGLVKPVKIIKFRFSAARISLRKSAAQTVLISGLFPLMAKISVASSRSTTSDNFMGYNSSSLLPQIT